jgi:nicotinamidase-related amidase
MNEHQQISEIIQAKNKGPVALDPRRAALLVVDMQRYFTEPRFLFTQLFEKLSPGATTGYHERVRQRVIPSIRKLLGRFRSAGAAIVFTAVGTETGDGRELPCWLRAFDDLGVNMLGERVWPPVNNPSWQIDPALTP